MNRLTILSGLGLVTASLVACQSAAPKPPVTTPPPTSSSSSSVAGRYATVEGVVQKAGIGIAMEGTHKLEMDDGSFLLLRSSMVRLDDSLDMRVVVTGAVQPTVEVGGMIMNVEMLQRAQPIAQPEVLEETSSASSSSISPPVPPFSSAAPIVLSSKASSATAPSSVLAPVRSSAAVASSSAKPLPSPSSSSSSIAAPSSSSPAPATTVSLSVKAMSKAAVDAANFSTKYCSGHIGFCLPIHRNWYFQSFGANVSPYLWHVEVADHSVEDVGQGVIIVNLVSGTFEGSEGVAVAGGDFVVASKQWTGSRHFEISGPKELKAAVEFMANGVEVYSTE